MGNIALRLLGLNCYLWFLLLASAFDVCMNIGVCFLANDDGGMSHGFEVDSDTVAGGHTSLFASYG